MTKNYLRFALVAIVASLLFTACGSSKKAKTPEQKSAMNRGVIMEKEECEQLALKEVKGWRESGNGVSDKESFARNIAELNAKARLARQLQEQINTLIRSFNEQHEAGGVREQSGKSTEIEEGYADQLLSNVKPICSNTYVKEDGSYNVYVCVEMGEESLSRIHKKLSDDKKLSIDFAEDQFKKQMEKAKEEYRNRQ
ncbi:MAG: hypothetical protein LBQ28_10650 [Prevotellaceae bacterium]|jgi:hypothetical protein|nr:hypothetical protein [Prevotellaceae bacterium]